MRKPWIVIAFGLVGCGALGLGKSGARCATSEECGAGLLCDTTQSPAICTDKVANRPDGSAPPKDSGLVQDLAGADLTGVAPPDMTGEDLSATPGDMTKAPADLATPLD